MQQKQIFITIILLAISTLAQAQWTKADLSAPRGELGATFFNGKVLFFGGLDRATNAESDVMDIYDPTTQKWTTSTMPTPRTAMSYYATASKLYTYGAGFSDRNKIDIYDGTTGAWSQLTVQAAANSSKSKIKGLGNKLYVNYDQVLHEFDLATATNTALNNTGAQRYETAFEVAGTKLMIAGGISGNTVSKDIDIYDAAAKTWSKSSLSEARRSVTTLVHQGKVYFIGGGTDNGYKNSAAIDVYDIANNKWSIITMPFKRIAFAVTALGDNLYIAGGYTEAQDESDVVNIYNLKTLAWTTSKMTAKKIRLAATTDGKKVFFAGGNLGSTSYQSVDIWSPSTALGSLPLLELSLKTYPNPMSEKLSIEWQNTIAESLALLITDNLGRVIHQEKVFDYQNRLELDTKTWQQGIYQITLSDGKAVQSCKVRKE